MEKESPTFQSFQGEVYNTRELAFEADFPFLQAVYDPALQHEIFNYVLCILEQGKGTQHTVEYTGPNPEIILPIVAFIMQEVRKSQRRDPQ